MRLSAYHTNTRCRSAPGRGNDPARCPSPYMLPYGGLCHALHLLGRTLDAIEADDATPEDDDGSQATFDRVVTALETVRGLTERLGAQRLDRASRLT